ncbi:TPA: hypothetical protein ACWL76_003989 [Klebsiella michiganensis]
MTKSTITRERLQEIAEDGFLKHGESKELARMVLDAMDSEPVIADCDPEVYEKGASACLVAIPKETAEVICKGISAVTGCKIDWHYIGGRVNIKALRLSPQPVPVVQMVPEEPPEHLLPKGNSRDATYRRGAIILGWKLCRAAMLAAALQEVKGE